MIKENIPGHLAAWYNHRIPSLRTVYGAPEFRPPLYKLPKHLILFLNWLTGRYLQQTIITVSPDLAKKLEHDYPKTKIKVIENGVDINTLKQCISHKTTQNTNKNRYRIGIAGFLVPIKRGDLFIESAFYRNNIIQSYPSIFISMMTALYMISYRHWIGSQQANDYVIQPNKLLPPISAFINKFRLNP